MATTPRYDQWFELNRAVFEPFVRWNEVTLQSVERLAGNRQFFEQWLELNRAAVEPVLRWQEIAFQTAEKITRRNLNVVQDYLELGARQLNLWREVQDPQKWKDEESKLAAEFSQKIVEHAGSYLEVAKEARDALNELTNQTARQFAEQTHKAAQTAAETAEKAGEAAKAAGTRAAGQPSRSEAAAAQKG
ncbi:phasin family protein [Candidatus Methylocalor cossyra]|uniref:Phasin protein n=1 Tax=Candidatus Methylocalor cossyra TaxID=3108543 RepID=A0ABM9NJB6_9GAMM